MQEKTKLPVPLGHSADVKSAQKSLAKAQFGLTTSIINHIEGFFAALLRLPLVKEVKFIAEEREDDGSEYTDFHVVVNSAHQLLNLEDSDDMTVQALHTLLEPFEAWLEENDPYHFGLDYNAFARFYADSTKADEKLPQKLYVRYGLDAQGKLIQL